MQILKIDERNYAKELTIRVPSGPTLQTNNLTFYLSSETTRGVEYVIRTRDRQLSYYGAELEHLCTCPDFSIRRWSKHEDCKHIETIKLLTARVGGVSQLARLVSTIE